MGILEPLISLERLDLKNNIIKNVDFLKPLTSLKHLDLWNCSQLKNIDGLSALLKLEILWMACHKVTDIRPLFGLKYLTTIVGLMGISDQKQNERNSKHILEWAGPPTHKSHEHPLISCEQREFVSRCQQCNELAKNESFRCRFCNYDLCTNVFQKPKQIF